MRNEGERAVAGETHALEGLFDPAEQGGLVEIDDIDLRVVEALQADALASYDSIAEFAGISSDSVRMRIDKMQAAGVLRLEPWTEPYRCGLGLLSILLIQVRPERLEQVFASLVDVEGIARVLALAGEYNLSAEVVCRDAPHLEQVLQEEIESIDGVEAVAPHIVTGPVYRRIPR